jgi:hypothetical protein
MGSTWARLGQAQVAGFLFNSARSGNVTASQIFCAQDPPPVEVNAKRALFAVSTPETN